MRVHMSTVLWLRVPDFGYDIGRVGSKGADSYWPFSFDLVAWTIATAHENS